MSASPHTAAAVGAHDSPRGAIASDWQRVRQDFPALAQQVHGKPWVYLDSAATALKPQAVIDAVVRAYGADCSNIHRGVHTVSQRATDAFERARVRVGEFLNAGSERQVVFVRGTTEGINLVADSYALPRLAAGDEIVITELEHHSNIVPWQLVCERSGAKLRVVPMTDRGEIEVADVERMLTSRTKLLAVSHVSNALGTILPVQQIVVAAHGRGVPVLVDGAQAVPHIDVDLDAINCDFYVFSGHKLYGPTGIGALVAKTSLLEQMRPYQGGGDMIKSVTFEKTVYHDLPHRFEAGTPHIAGAIGLGAALDYLDALGKQRVFAHGQEMLAYAHARLREVPGLRFIGEASRKAAVAAFTLGDVHPHDIGTVLDMEGVAVRAGHHCAQPVMQHYGIAASVRASLGVYTDKTDIDALVTALERVTALFGE